MSNSIIETTVIPPHQKTNENTNGDPASPAPLDSTAPAPKATRSKSPAVPNQPPAAKPHCRHRVRTGAYCRLPVSDPKTSLCFRHASLRLQEVDSGDLSEEFVCGIKEFDSAVDINHVLGELYKLLAANKISPRRGAVMAYTCNLLLRTLPAIEQELEPEAPQFVFDLPRPKRDDDISPERAFVNRMSELHIRASKPVRPTPVTAGLPTRSNPNDPRSQSESVLRHFGGSNIEIFDT